MPACCCSVSQTIADQVHNDLQSDTLGSKLTINLHGNFLILFVHLLASAPIPECKRHMFGSIEIENGGRAKVQYSGQDLRAKVRAW